MYKKYKPYLTLEAVSYIIAFEMMNGYEIAAGALPERTEEELLEAMRAGEREAGDLLVRRCFRLVKSCARPYFLAGADSDDLIQEGMLGLLNAVHEFEPARGVPFSQYARVCISRAVISAVRSSLASKHSVLNDAVPLEKPLFEDIAQSSTRVSGPAADPEALVIGMEARDELLTQLGRLLSDFEGKVLSLFLDGYSYEEMAAKLGRPVKSVDNAVQRIRRKSAQLSGDNRATP